MSFLGRIAARTEQRRLERAFYGEPVAPRYDVHKFAQKLDNLIETEVAARRMDRPTAMSVLAGKVDDERRLVGDNIAKRNTTTPKVYSGNLPNSKLKFFQKGN